MSCLGLGYDPSLKPADLGEMVWTDGGPIFWGVVDQGGSMLDLSGNRRGITNNGAISRSSMPGGPSLNYGGVSGERSNTTLPFTPPVGSMAIGFTFRTSSSGTEMSLVGFGNDSGGTATTADRAFFIDSNGYVGWYVFFGVQNIIKSNSPLNDGRPHDILGVIDSGVMRMYVDGTIQSATISGVPNGYNGYTSPYFLIGKIGAPDTGIAYLVGDVDDVRIYNYAPSSSAVLADRADPWWRLWDRPPGWTAKVGSTLFRRTLYDRTGSRGVPL